MANEQKKAAQEFTKYWEGKGYEKGESQSFWNMLLRDVLGVEKPETFIEYEDQVLMDKSTGFIDGYIPSSKVLIEQKSIDKDLRKATRQSDGSLLTPFQQAKKYIVDLPVDRHPRWVITCNFKEFNIYDMNKPSGEPAIILLKDLPKEYYRLSFIADTTNVHLKKEMELSLKAGDIVGELYDAFSKQYNDLSNKHSVESLNKLCVRIVFCLYAEDAELFKFKNQFHDYLNKYSAREMRQALIDLFKILNTPEDKRSGLYLTDDVLQFPYVNGGLFEDEDIEIPLFTDEIRELLLAKASDNFNWSEISPTIFGAVFESTLNPETRRSGGMHYTSIENIHKVIDPLFLNKLKSELEEIKELKQQKQIDARIHEFQDKLARLTFLDPAAGSGNFLTETYISLRKLENEALEVIHGQQLQIADPIKVSISQFYGIEINDFAVSVAQTALWIAESQMMHETEELLGMHLNYLPLKSFSNYVEGNALSIDWNDVIPSNKLNYIMGNPPFIGKKYQTKEQKADLVALFQNQKGIGNIDYVCGWYKKALDYMLGTKIEAAFVSTSSIVQGEQVPLFWKPLFDKYPITINFGYRNFRWDSEANIKAHVHCVIIGFSVNNARNEKFIYDIGSIIKANNIHPYLIDMPLVFIDNRSKPLFDLKPLVYGSFALDDGNYTISEEEYNDIVKREPNIEKYLKPFIGSEEFINNRKRFCVWLKGADITEVRNSNTLMTKIENVRNWRLQSNRKETKAAANTPMLFAEIRQPDSNFLAIPITSSEKRRYIPMGYMSCDVIASNHLLVLPNATLFDFGLLTSNVHMAWMRAVAGRLETRYNYSARIVYNNFPYIKPSPEKIEKVEKCANAILDARQLYPNSSLADLYDELTMPPELRKAHQENDKAVMEAYGFDWRTMTESECVAELMKMYQELTSK